MVPGDLVGLVLLLAAVSPGYVYVRVDERFRSRPERSALMETAEMLATGAACTTLAALAVLAIGEAFDGLAVDVARWSSEGNSYARARPYAVARSVGLVLVVASVLAGLGARWANRGQRAGIIPGANARGVVFGAASPENPAWVGVHLKDGPILEGYLWAFSTAGSDAQEIALRKPIGYTKPGGARVELPNVDSVVIATDEVAIISVHMESDPPRLVREAGRPWWRRLPRTLLRRP